MIEIQWHPTRKDLRVFSLLLIVFCGVVAMLMYFRSGSFRWPAIIATVGLVAGVIGCLRPAAIRPVYLSWMVATFPIGWTVSHLILAAVYFFVFTPIGWLLRLTGHDPMKCRRDRSRDTYWEPRTSERKPADYFRQF